MLNRRMFRTTANPRIASPPSTPLSTTPHPRNKASKISAAKEEAAAAAAGAAPVAAAADVKTEAALQGDAAEEGDLDGEEGATRLVLSGARGALPGGQKRKRAVDVVSRVRVRVRDGETDVVSRVRVRAGFREKG